MEESTMKQAMTRWQLQQSMGEEMAARSIYKERAIQSEQYGDALTAALYGVIAEDELEHYTALNERLNDLVNETGGSTGEYITHNPNRVTRKVDEPRFKVGDTVVFRKAGGDDITGKIYTIDGFRPYVGYEYGVDVDGVRITANERKLRLVNCGCQSIPIEPVAYDCNVGIDVPRRVCKSGDIAKMGDDIYNTFTQQIGKVVDMSGDVRYGTIIFVDYKEPAIKTWKNPDGSTGQMVISDSGVHAYSPGDWRKLMVKIT